MCLYIDKEKTKNHSSLKKNIKLTFYKIFTIRKFNKKDFVICTYYQEFKIKIDTKIIEPKSFFFDINSGMIEGGACHAYINDRKNLLHYNNEICIPIIVESNDVIAFGNNGDVCFSKYEISKSSWQLVKSKIKENNILLKSLL
jgi:hypothetical protein